MRKIIALAIVLCIAPACSWLGGDDGMFRDRKNDYLEAKVLPPLIVPETEEGPEYTEESVYTIPEVTNTNQPGSDFQVPRPTPLVDAGGQAVRIQKLGDARWLLIDVPPSQLWQRVKNFLIENAIPIYSDSAATGLLETAWLQRIGEEEAPEVMERYRYRIDQGVQRNSSEVHVTQFQQAFSSSASPGIDWPAESVSDVREEWMVRELAQYLADSDGAAAVSLLAQDIGSVSKVALKRDATRQFFLDLELPFERGWASTGQALKKARFEIADLDRSAGKYYVSFRPGDEEDDPGFFGRLFKGGKNDEAVQEYEISVVRSETGTEIRLFGPGAIALEEDLTHELLERLKGFLS